MFEGFRRGFSGMNFNEMMQEGLGRKYDNDLLRSQGAFMQGQGAADTGLSHLQQQQFQRQWKPQEMQQTQQRIGVEQMNANTQRAQAVSSQLSPFGAGTIAYGGLGGPGGYQAMAPGAGLRTAANSGGGWYGTGSGNSVGGTTADYAAWYAANNPAQAAAGVPAAAPAPAAAAAPVPTPYKSALPPVSSNVVPSALTQQQQTAARVAQIPKDMKKGGVVGNVRKDRGKDTIKARVRPGEYMLNPETVAFMGGGDYSTGLRKLNDIVRQATGKEPGPSPVGKSGRPGFADSGAALFQPKRGFVPTEPALVQNPNGIGDFTRMPAGGMSAPDAPGVSDLVERPALTRGSAQTAQVIQQELELQRALEAVRNPAPASTVYRPEGYQAPNPGFNSAQGEAAYDAHVRAQGAAPQAPVDPARANARAYGPMELDAHGRPVSVQRFEPVGGRPSLGTVGTPGELRVPPRPMPGPDPLTQRMATIGGPDASLQTPQGFQDPRAATPREIIRPGGVSPQAAQYVAQGGAAPAPTVRTMPGSTPAPQAPLAPQPAPAAAPVNDVMAGEAGAARPAPAAAPAQAAPAQAPRAASAGPAFENTPEGYKAAQMKQASANAERVYKETLAATKSPQKAAQAATKAHAQSMTGITTNAVAAAPAGPATTGFRGGYNRVVGNTFMKGMGPAAVGFGALQTIQQAPEEHDAFAASLQGPTPAAPTLSSTITGKRGTAPPATASVASVGLNTLTNIGNIASMGLAPRVGQAISNAVWTPGGFRERAAAAAQGFAEGPQVVNNLAGVEDPRFKGVPAKPAQENGPSTASAPVEAPSVAPPQQRPGANAIRDRLHPGEEFGIRNFVAAQQQPGSSQLLDYGPAYGNQFVKATADANGRVNTFSDGGLRNPPQEAEGGGGAGAGGGGFGDFGGTTTDYMNIKKTQMEQQRLAAEFQQRAGIDERNTNVKEQEAQDKRAAAVRESVESAFGKGSYEGVARGTGVHFKQLVDENMAVLRKKDATPEQQAQASEQLNAYGKPIYKTYVGEDGRKYRQVTGYTPKALSEITDQGALQQVLNDFQLGKSIYEKRKGQDNWYSEIAPYAGAAAGLGAQLYWARRGGKAPAAAATTAARQSLKQRGGAALTSGLETLKHGKLNAVKTGAFRAAPTVGGAAVGMGVRDELRMHQLPPTENYMDYVPKHLSEDGKRVVLRGGHEVPREELIRDDAGTFGGTLRHVFSKDSETINRHKNELEARIRHLQPKKKD